jgi:hypothetical protein
VHKYGPREPRFQIRIDFFAIGKNVDHERFIKLVKSEMFKEFLVSPAKKIYLFHWSKLPICNVGTGLGQEECVMLADTTPKFDIPCKVEGRLVEEIGAWEERLGKYNMQLLRVSREAEKEREVKSKEMEKESRMKGHQKECYEWEKIKNVKQYVDRVI